MSDIASIAEAVRDGRGTRWSRPGRPLPGFMSRTEGRRG